MSDGINGEEKDSLIEIQIRTKKKEKLSQSFSLISRRTVEHVTAKNRINVIDRAVKVMHFLDY